MKNVLKKLTIFLFVFVFLVMLGGCSVLKARVDAPSNELVPPSDFNPDVDRIPEQSTNAGNGGNTDKDAQDSISPFGPYGELADEAHLAFYNRAFRMYSWIEFGTSTLHLDVEDTIDVEGIPYSKVTDPLFDTPDKLQSELSSCFSDDICRLITESVFIERDGFLYAPDMARGADITVLDEELHLTEETNTKRVYTMIVFRDEDMDGICDHNETYVYEAEKIDGKFKFTVFPFYL